MAVECSLREDGSWLIVDDGVNNPEDDWLFLPQFPECLHEAITKSSTVLWNGTPMFPPPRPWAAQHYDGMFCTAIVNEKSPVRLLVLAREVQLCPCLTDASRANLLLNIRNQL